MKKPLLIFLTCILLSGCGNQGKESIKSDEKIIITVSAAASLKNTLNDIEKLYEAEHKHIDIKFNYGASGALAQQIMSGAPVDIFFSAAQDKVDDLVKNKAVDKEDTKSLLKNHLVLISEDKLTSLDNLQEEKIKKIALGNPELVPAGEYGKQALENKKLYQKVKSKLVLTKDVRQVLTYVETGNTEAGIIYTSDLKSTNKIKYTLKIQDDLHEPITYPIAKIKDTKYKKETEELYQYLQNDQSKKVYQKYGFDINGKE